MLITRKSMFTGITRTREINVTEDQIMAWEKGMLIQKAMPQLTPEEREFIKTGVTGEEWQNAFGGDE